MLRLCTSRSCVAARWMGYFSGGLLRHVDLITHAEECRPLGWQWSVGSGALTSAVNKTGSGRLAHNKSLASSAESMFRWVRRVWFSGGGQAASLWKPCWQRWHPPCFSSIFSFSLVRHVTLPFACLSQQVPFYLDCCLNLVEKVFRRVIS